MSSNKPNRIDPVEIKLTLPYELASALALHGETFIEQLKIQFIKTVEDPIRSQQEQEKMESHKSAYFLACVQAYRFYRSIRPMCENDREACQQIAEADVSALNRYQAKDFMHMVQYRRKVVKVYIKNRREKTILRLMRLGKTNRQMGEYLGLHEKTIARFAREVKKSIASQRQGS